MIEDEELRNIFKTASEEHLQKLDEGLLYLEQHSHDPEKLEELLREAHSLKGDAGMLGVKDVATLAHQLEHILGGIKRGEIQLSQTISDRLAFGLDAIRKLVNEAVTGEPSGITAFYVLANMMGAETNPQPTSEPPNQEAPVEKTPIVEADTNNPTESLANEGSTEEKSDITPQPRRSSNEVPSQVAENQVAADPPSKPFVPPQEPIIFPYPGVEVGFISSSIIEQPPTPALAKQAERDSTLPVPPQPYDQKDGKTPPQPTYRIDTIRVETRHLDSLMTQAGELTVTKTRINHRLAEIEEIVTLFDEWSRDAFVHRLVLEQAESKQATAVNPNGARNNPIERFPESGMGRKKRVWQNERGSATLRHEEANGMLLKQFQHFHHRTEKRLERLVALVNQLRNALYEDTQRLDVVADELEEGIRTLRLLPLATIFNLFPRMVRDLARQENKEVTLTIEGSDTKADKRILEAMKDPLMHMIRNALDHGIETAEERENLAKPRHAKIQVKGYQTATNVVIEVMDDGRGLDLDKIKHTAIKRGLRSPEQLATMTVSQIQSLIFEPGFSTRTFVTEVSGRGVGLDVVRTNVENLKGTIQVDSVQGIGCTIRILLPNTLATAHVLIVLVDEIPYAIPVEFVQMTRFIAQDDLFTIEGRDTILFDSRPISVAHLSELLELEVNQSPASIANSSAPLPCVVIKVGEELVAMIVDAVLDEQDVMLKSQSQLLKRVRNVSGATILGTGEVCMVLNPQDLIRSVRKQALSLSSLSQSETQVSQRKQSILLVEDSIAIRTQEKRILESAGYEVVTAVDGLDAFKKLKSRAFDAIVSDIQMPNLDGLSLTLKIRQYKEYSELPIILVTSLASEEDKRRGAEAGANAYITKGTFNQEVLLETLRRLV